MEILPHRAAAPLGVMVRGIMESLLDAEALEKLLQEYAPQQYTLELTIDALVSLLIQVSARPPGVCVRCLHCRPGFDATNDLHQLPGTLRQTGTDESQSQ